MQNNGAMKIVNFTHAQTAETRRSFRPTVNAGYEATCRQAVNHHYTIYSDMNRNLV